MKASLDDSVRKLCNLSHQLNDYTERLNARLSEMEAELRDAGLGLRLWLDKMITANGPDGETLDFRLGWAKGSFGWGFSWITEEEIQRQTEPSALSDAPRWVRIAAFPHVPYLIDKLIAAAEDTLEGFGPVKDELPALKPAPEQPAPPADEEDIPF